MTGETRRFRLQPWALAMGLAAGVAFPAQAQSLATLYESARSFDASYQSAKSQFDATLAKSAQARAAILPSANSRSQLRHPNGHH
jgi:outer membrane protein